MLTCLSPGILNLPVFIWGPSTFVLTLITFLITFTALCSPLTGTIALQQPRVVLERWRVRFTLWKNSPHIPLKLAIAMMHRVGRSQEGGAFCLQSLGGQLWTQLSVEVSQEIDPFAVTLHTDTCQTPPQKQEWERQRQPLGQMAPLRWTGCSSWGNHNTAVQRRWSGPEVSARTSNCCSFFPIVRPFICPNLYQFGFSLPVHFLQRYL